MKKERGGDFIICHLLISLVSVTISYGEGKLKSVIFKLVYIVCLTFFTHLLVCFSFYLFVFVLYQVLFVISIFLFNIPYIIKRTRLRKWNIFIFWPNKAQIPADRL